MPSPRPDLQREPPQQPPLPEARPRAETAQLISLVTTLGLAQRLEPSPPREQRCPPRDGCRDSAGRGTRRFPTLAPPHLPAVMGARATMACTAPPLPARMSPLPQNPCAKTLPDHGTARSQALPSSRELAAIAEGAETPPASLVTFAGAPRRSGDGAGRARRHWQWELALGEAPGLRLPPPRSRSAISRFLAGLEAAQMEAPEPAPGIASAAPRPGWRHHRAPRPAPEKAPALVAGVSCLLPARCHPAATCQATDPTRPRGPPGAPVLSNPRCTGSLQSWGGICPAVSCLPTHGVFLHPKATRSTSGCREALASVEAPESPPRVRAQGQHPAAGLGLGGLPEHRPRPGNADRLHHQPHCSRDPSCVAPAQPHHHPWGVMAGPHHLPGVSARGLCPGLRSRGRSCPLPDPTAPSPGWSRLCVGQKAGKEARKAITWLLKGG